MVLSLDELGPASNSKTFLEVSAESLLASTQPAVPPPTMMKSKAWLVGGEKGWRGVPAVSATLEAARGGARGEGAEAAARGRGDFFFEG